MGSAGSCDRRMVFALLDRLTTILFMPRHTFFIWSARSAAVATCLSLLGADRGGAEPVPEIEIVKIEASEAPVISIVAIPSALIAAPASDAPTIVRAARPSEVNAASVAA